MTTTFPDYLDTLCIIRQDLKKTVPNLYKLSKLLMVSSHPLKTP